MRRAAANWPLNMKLISSWSTASLVWNMFWKVLAEMLASAVIWLMVVAW